MTEYKRLGDYIREVIIRNREHRAMLAYSFGDGSQMEDVTNPSIGSK